MGEYATPETEKILSNDELFREIVLVSSAPVDINGHIYYLPIVDGDDLKTTITKADLIEGITKDFFKQIRRASLKIISGLSGKLLHPYQYEHKIVLLTTTQGLAYVAYGWLDGQFLRMSD